MVEASYVKYPTLGWPKGQQQTLESCCSTTRQMRNQVLDVNEALTFTVINSRNTKLSKHNRQIGGGATATSDIGGGYILAHSTDLHQVVCQIEMPQLCETTI